MEDQQVVVVRRFGMLSALVIGLCATLAVIVLCATAVALYGMYLLDGRIDQFTTLAPEALGAIAEWRKAMPPALSDALHDHRDLNYLKQIEVQTRLIEDPSRHVPCAVVEITNHGRMLISLMSLRVTAEDKQGVPLDESITYAATPLAMESDWRGPLMPGQTRRLAVHFARSLPHPSQVTVEVTELRVWQPAEHSPRDAATDSGLPAQAPAARSDDADASAAKPAEQPALPPAAEKAAEKVDAPQRQLLP